MVAAQDEVPCALAETQGGVAQACPAPGPSCPSDSSGGPDAESPLSRVYRLAYGRLPPSLRRSFLQGLARFAAQLGNTCAVGEAFAGSGIASKSLAVLSQVYKDLFDVGFSMNGVAHKTRPTLRRPRWKAGSIGVGVLTLMGCSRQSCAAAVGTLSQEVTRMHATVVVQDQKLTIPVFDVMMYVLLIIFGYILSKGNDMRTVRKSTRMTRATKDAEVQTESQDCVKPSRASTVWLAQYGDDVHVDERCAGLAQARHGVSKRRVCRVCTP